MDRPFIPVTKRPISVNGSKKPFFSSSIERNVFVIIMCSLLYQVALCLINTLLFRITPSLVMLVEFVIYALIFSRVVRQIPRYLGLMILLTIVNVTLLFLIRSFIDPKSARDLIIILMFFWLGFNHGSKELVDKILICILVIAIALGLFEWLGLGVYTKLFNTYSYFLNQSGIGSAGGSIFEGQELTLNGFRPDGIGRTILPWLFGSHRISSISMEPVSLGNFAVIVLIWAISGDNLSERRSWFFLFASAALISLADSRFGLAMSAMVLFLRVLLPLRFYSLLAFVPWAMLCGLYVYSNYIFKGIYSDSFIGRLTHTGHVLGQLNVTDILGFQSPFDFYGDMGYAYVLTRFGVIYLLLLWFGFWCIPISSSQAIRVRGLISVYIAMILSVSGTSLFALKSAGFLWFMLGSLCAEKKKHIASSNTLGRSSDYDN